MNRGAAPNENDAGRRSGSEGEMLRVLCVEDTPEDAELMRELLLDEGFNVTMVVVDTLEGTRNALDDGPYDIVLSDYNLLGFTGKAALELVLDAAPQTPFIIVSGSIGEEIAVDLLKMGADDYVLKDRLSRLPYAIRSAIDARREQAARQQAQDDLREISRRDAEALTLAKMAYWDFDVATATFRFNDRFYRLHGVTDSSDDEMRIDDFIHRYVHPAFKPHFSDAVRRAMDTRDADFRLQTDMQLLHTDGAVQWVSTTFFIDKDEAGNTVRLHGVNQDITERKQYEQAQRTAEERFSKAFQASPSAMLIIRRADGMILNANDAFLGLLGFSRDETIGAKATALTEMADLDEDPAVLAVLAEQGSLRDYETTLRTRDGEVRDVSMSMEIIEFGTEPCLLSSFFDLTERRRAEESLHTALHDTVRALGAVATLRDPYTGDHERRVTILADAIAAEMQLPADRREGLRMAGEVHDVGKIGVPAEILSKPGRLTDVEFRLVAQHAARGYEILRDIAFRWPVAEIVHQHHERLDGSGYPRGLSGDQILLEARILAVADVAEAMASHRPYRPTLGMDAALDELRNGAGRLYDPDAVAICEHVLRTGTVDLSAI